MGDEPRDAWRRAVVRVGDGRGCVVETEREHRFIITAGHCLPHLPRCHAASYPEERTYAELIGPLGAEPTVSAECVFVDPVADLAVLCSPDGQEFGDEAAAYETLTEGASPLSIGSLTYVRKFVTLPRVRRKILGPPQAESGAWLLSLDGRWFSCRVRSRGKTLWIEDAAESIRGGMSGSPVMVPGGAAIGVVSIGDGPNPELGADLPAWILRFTRAVVRPAKP